MNSPTSMGEQAILLCNIGSTEIFDCVKAIGNIIGPNNITHASKVSNMHICIYLKSKKHVENLIQNTRSINLNNTTIKISPVIFQVLSLTIYNVHPDIPDEIIVNALRNKDLEIISSNMTTIKAGFDDEYAHILTLQRKINIKNNKNVPKFLEIKYENTVFKMFIACELIPFNIYEQHVYRHCPEINKQFIVLCSLPIPKQIQNNKNFNTTTITSPSTSSQPHSSSITDTNLLAAKRRAEEVSSSESDISDTESNQGKKRKN